MPRPDILVPVKIYVSAVAKASVEDLAKHMGGFDELDKWVPAVASCKLEGGAHPMQLGAVRQLRSDAGEGLLREPLLAINADPFPSCTYGMHESRAGEASLLPGQPYDYRATVGLRPITMASPASTLLEFTATFLAEPKDATKLEGAITGIFTQAFGGLQEHFA